MLKIIISKEIFYQSCSFGGPSVVRTGAKIALQMLIKILAQRCIIVDPVVMLFKLHI